MRYHCPKCGSPNVATERRPNGDSKCQYHACLHSGPTSTFVLKESEMEKEVSENTCAIAPSSLNSMNGRFVLESYKEDRALKATVQNGFAMVAQKVSLKPLRILADVYSPVTGQRLARRGDKAYVREAYLQSQPWAKQTFTADGIEGEFIIAEMAHVEFVESK